MRMISKIKNIFSSKFYKDVELLSIGTLFKAGIAFIGSIFITRLLGVEDYGIYSIAISFSATLLIFTRFSFSSTLTTLLSEAMGEKKQQSIKELVVWYVKSVCLVNILIIILITIVPFLARIFYPDLDKIGWYVQIYLASVFFSGVFLFVRILLQILRRTKELSYLEVGKDFLWRLIAIIFLVLGFKIFGVILAQLFVAVIFLGIGLFVYVHLRKKTNFMLPSFKEIVTNFSSVSVLRHVKFTTALSIDNNLASLYTSLPIFLLGIFSNETQAGYLGLAFNLIAVPKSFAGNISRMLSSVLPYRQGEDNKLTWIQDVKKTSKIATPVLAFILILFGVVSWYAIPFVYGEEFSGARIPLMILVVANLGIGFTLSSGPIVRTMKRMKAPIITNIISVILMCTVIYYLAPKYGAIGAVIGMVVWEIIHWIFMIYLYRILNKEKYG